MPNFGDRRLPTPVNCVTAGLAASAGRLMANPFAIAKIYAETGVPGGKMGFSTTCRWIVKLHRPSQLFTRGALVAAGRALPHYTIKFAVFDRLAKTFITRQRVPGQFPSMDVFIGTWIAGACGGVAATLVTHPLDLVKTRLVVQPSGPAAYYRGLSHALSTILAQEGVYRGIYRGLGISLIGSAMFSGNLFLAWETWESLPWRSRPATESALYHEEVWGPFAFLAAAFGSTQVIDVLRRKQMAQSYILPKEGNVDVKFRSLVQCFMEMYRRGNLYSYTFGLFPNVLKVVPQLTTFIVVLKLSQWSLVTVSGQKEVH